MKKRVSVILCIVLLCVCGYAVGRVWKRYNPDEISSPKYCEKVMEQVFGGDLQDSAPEILTDERINLDESFYLYDFYDRPVAIFYKLRPGYAIYDYAEGYVRQYSTDQDSDVYTDSNTRYYYKGPYRYYIKTEEGFYNLWTGQVEKK